MASIMVAEKQAYTQIWYKRHSFATYWIVRLGDEGESKENFKDLKIE